MSKNLTIFITFCTLVITVTFCLIRSKELQENVQSIKKLNDERSAPQDIVKFQSAYKFKFQDQEIDTKLPDGYEKELKEVMEAEYQDALEDGRKLAAESSNNVNEKTPSNSSKVQQKDFNTRKLLKITDDQMKDEVDSLAMKKKKLQHTLKDKNKDLLRDGDKNKPTEEVIKYSTISRPVQRPICKTDNFGEFCDAYCKSIFQSNGHCALYEAIGYCICDSYPPGYTTYSPKEASSSYNILASIGLIIVTNIYLQCQQYFFVNSK